MENKEPDKKDNPDVAYDTLATDEPIREVETPPDVPPSTGGSLSERMASSGDLTDMQAILMRIFPDVGGDIGSMAMMGRIHPDVFLPWIEIMSTNEVMGSDPNKPIDVAAIRAKWYGAFSIGLDGKGRIDALELGGAARDTKMAEKKLDL
jgi:hypothetical protein